MSISQFFEGSEISEILEFPHSKSEEYRYSKVIEALEKISPKINRGQEFTIDQDADYIFFSDQTVNLSTISFDDLDRNFHRHENYFKSASLSIDKNFKQITCDKEEMRLIFAASESSVNQHKVYIDVPPAQKSKIYIDVYTQDNSFMMPLIYVNAEANTHVEIIYTANGENNTGILNPNFEFIAGNQSHSSLQAFTKGIRNQRMVFIGYCAGKESHIDLRTGFYLEEDEACDLFVRMHHEAADSTSNQMIKSVADDQSQMNFNGLIFANKQAHNIYAYQMLKGMLLSDDADIFARPQLDIDYYELACSHGVSIGGFDPEELFYLKSRGIQAKDVYPLLLYGFFAESFLETDLEEYWVERIKLLLGTISG